MSSASRGWGRSHTTGSRVVVRDVDGNFLRLENPHAKIRGKGVVRYKSNETLMFHALNLIFPGERHLDHHRPDWLVNPRTGKNLELDRYYPDLDLAFEYNGRHHDDRQQQVRDAIKVEACRRRGIALVIVPSGYAISAKDIVDMVAEARATSESFPSGAPADS